MISLIKISPSILAADFARLGEEISSIAEADYLHFDVMDGLFVPNISIGVPVLESVRKITDMVLDVHLMITEPRRLVDAFIDAGADIVVIHIESDTPEHITEALKAIKARGKKAGLSLKPATPAEAVSPYIELVDLILVMTVEPGFGGQSFMSDMLPKIERLRNMIDQSSQSIELEVDGGINSETAKLCLVAGANVLVAGSAVFKASDRTGMIRTLRGARL